VEGADGMAAHPTLWRRSGGGARCARRATKAKRKAKANGHAHHHQPSGDHRLDILRRFGMVLGEGSDGGVNIRCPWDGEHSEATSGSATTFWPAKSGNKPGFKCLHGHCALRTITDLHRWMRAMDPTFDPRPPDQRNGTDRTLRPDAEPEGGHEHQGKANGHPPPPHGEADYTDSAGTSRPGSSKGSTGNGSAKPFPSLSVEDINATPLKDPLRLVSGLIGERSTVLIWGPSTVGKSS
jgi:hypothetical protein